MSLQFSKQMYRKYTLTGTHVLNSHNYLISATQSDTRQGTLFHQILTPSNLPILADPSKIQSIISDSENQNVINQTKNGYEVYHEQNLVQIRLKKGILPLYQIKTLPFTEIMDTIGLLNLDFAMSSRQISANTRHNQLLNLNNSCKFYQIFMSPLENIDFILPFLSLEERKIHYYDICFQGQLGQNQDNFQPSVKHYRDGNKKSKHERQKTDEKHNTEEVAFKKYIYWLIKLMGCSSVEQFKKDLQMITQPQLEFEEIQASLNKIQMNLGTEIQQNLVKLLRKCLLKAEEYTINIFKKQCELIQEKHSKISSKQIPPEDQKNVNRFSNEKRGSFTLGYDSKKQIKPRLSKSFIDPNRNRGEERRPIRRQSAGRLKYSKSEITLNKTSDLSSGKPGRKLKKATLNLFKSSKIDPKNTSSHFFGDSSCPQFQKSAINTSGFFTKSNNLTKMSSAASNWFNASMQESELSGKLRNFKKGNKNISALNTPKHISQQKSGSAQVIEETDMVGEEELSRFSKIYNNRSKAKGIIEIEMKKSSPERIEEKIQINEPVLQVQATPVQKHKKIHCQQKILQDQFTMTETPKQQARNTPKLHLHKKSIINTMSLSFYEDNFKKNEGKEIKTVTSPNKSLKIGKESIKENSPQNQINKSSVDKENYDEKYQKSTKEKVKNQHPIPSNNKNDENIFDAPQEIEQIEQVLQKKIKNVESGKHTPKKLQKSIEIQQRLSKQQSQEVKQNTSKIHKPKAYTVQEKKTMVILPQSQKTFYLKHFEMVLKFCNEHKSTITLLSNSSNLTFLVNFLYYKTLLEHSNSENNTIYKKLVTLLEKKQQKFNPEQKEEYLMFRINCDSLWVKSKKIKILEQKIIKNVDLFLSGEEDIPCPDQLQDFLILTEQATLLLQKQTSILYKYIKSNKAMLINKGGFNVLLELGYMMVVTSIMSHQRLKYYECLDKHSFQDISGCFNFLFSQNQQEYISKYRSTLKQRQLAYLDSQEEETSLKNWIQQYS